MATNAYATLAELKDWLDIGDADDDALLDARLDSASRWIDYHCRRHFYQVDPAVARYFSFHGCRSDEPLLIDDLSAVTSIKADSDNNRSYETTWAATDYDLEPDAKILGGVAHPWTRVYLSPASAQTWPSQRRGIEITGKWRWPAVPHPVREAALILATRLWKRREAPFGTIGMGELGVQNIRVQDPDVLDLLRPFVSGPVVA